MTLAIFIVIVYAVFTLVGGVIGYVKAQSKASLIAGTVSGIILLGCAYGMPQKVRAAYFISLIVSAVLGVRFFRTWLSKKRVMPDLLMVILSVITFVLVSLDMATG